MIIERLENVSGAAPQFEDRREKELGFSNDREPTEAELGESMPNAAEGNTTFFVDKGPLFAACWWLNHFAQARGGDASIVPMEDVAARVKGVLGKLNREQDTRVIDASVKAAFAWYAARSKTV